MSATVTVIATFEARPGKEKQLQEALVGLLAPTRGERGCLNYDLHQSSENPAKFLFHENWASREDLEAHLQSEHVKALLPRVDELCVAFPQITTWVKIG
jgi:quinol monooxygenase YgiN